MPKKGETNRRLCLASRPTGTPNPSDFVIRETSLPSLQDGEFLIRNEYASIDPAIRRRLDDATSYIDAVALGQAIATTTVGQVVASKIDSIEIGDWYTGMNGIERYSVSKPGGLTRRLDLLPGDRLTDHLTKFGPVGLTAWFGLHEVARVRQGEAVLVTAAAGGVGSLVGQLARHAGCITIGIAGGADKCKQILDRYGYHYAIDYHGRTRSELIGQIREYAPEGVNVVFENVGGVILEAGLVSLAQNGRVALCGLIADYNLRERPAGINLRPLIAQRAKIRGFIMADYIDQFSAAVQAMRQVPDLNADEQHFHGLAEGYAAISAMFDGSATGKILLEID